MAIGTTAAILGAAAIGAAGSLAAGAIGSSAAGQASKTQAQAADKAVALQKYMYEQNRTDMLPWLTAGKTALQQYMGELGLSTTGAGGTPFESQFREAPGYQYAVEQAEKGVLNKLNALGMKNSGAALTALTRERLGMADQAYQTYLNRLQSTAGMGQTQANTIGQMGSSYANNASNTLQDAAAARASGYIGQANSWTNALGNMANIGSNALGWLSGNKGWAVT